MKTIKVSLDDIHIIIDESGGSRDGAESLESIKTMLDRYKLERKVSSEHPTWNYANVQEYIENMEKKVKE